MSYPGVEQLNSDVPDSLNAMGKLEMQFMWDAASSFRHWRGHARGSDREVNWHLRKLI
jgi:hypothetical protein